MFGFLWNNRGSCGCGERKFCYITVPKVCCERKCKKLYEIKEHCLCRDECKIDYENAAVQCGGSDGCAEPQYPVCGYNKVPFPPFGGCGKTPYPICGEEKNDGYGIQCGGEEFIGGFGHCAGCGKYGS
ncbi:MAG: hypothetical protein LBP79_04155 [Clostridiales bacterium]|jgi:hypothetical protein|nr:hypothetical protein [Clostridiales bacterium]